MFHPDHQELTLYKFNKRKGKYASVHPDDAGHHAIPELDLTIRLLEGWARFWWKGKLLPITLELQAEVIRGEKENAALRRQNEENARLIAEMQAELERLRKSAG